MSMARAKAVATSSTEPRNQFPTHLRELGTGATEAAAQILSTHGPKVSGIVPRAVFVVSES